MSENNINENSPEKSILESEAENRSENPGEQPIPEEVASEEPPAMEEQAEEIIITEKAESVIPEALNNTEITEEENEKIKNEDLRSRFQEFFDDRVIDSRPKMTDILLTFYDLKNIDEELTDIDEEKGDLPDIINSIKEKIAATEKEFSEKKNSTVKLESERDKITEDNKSFEERINKYDEQKYDVRSNDEYDGIVKTIESLFTEVEKNEKRLKEIAGIHKLLTDDVDALSAKSVELNLDLTEKQTLLDELDEQYKQDESGLREKRVALLTKLNDKELNLYERINNSYKGEATAIVRKGNCSGCYNSIPPQRVIEIKSAELIFTCQSCGRILISEEILASKEN